MTPVRWVVPAVVLICVGVLFVYKLQKTWRSTPSKTVPLNQILGQQLRILQQQWRRKAVRPELPRILCWVMCNPADLDRRVKHVKATWAKHCDITLYMSSERNDTFPTIGLDAPEGRDHISAKSKAAWTYIHDHYLDKADYFVKCDPDTFLIIPNLKMYLASRNPEEAEFFGHRFKFGGVPSKKYLYNSGGPGQVLSREAVRRLVEKAFTLPEDCMPDGQGEDYKTGTCLHLVGAEIVDTRDTKGRETFMVFEPSYYVHGRFPEWYYRYDTDGALWGYLRECCSDRPIGFHYLSPEKQYIFYYLFYKVHGTNHSISNDSPVLRFYNSTVH